MPLRAMPPLLALLQLGVLQRLPDYISALCLGLVALMQIVSQQDCCIEISATYSGLAAFLRDCWSSQSERPT